MNQPKIVKIERNGYIFQIDLNNPHIRYFGGGGTKVKTMDPFAGTGYREAYKRFTDWLRPSIGPITPYPEQITPGFSPLQQAGFDVAGGLTPIATGGQEYFGDIYGRTDVGVPGRAIGTAEQALADVLAPYDPEMAKRTMEPARELALDTYFRDIVPRLKESYVSRAGTADAGALNRALAREGSRMSLGLSAQLAPYLYAGSEAQKSRQQAGVGQAMNLAQMPGAVLGQAGQIGGMGTDILSQLLNMGAMQRDVTGELMAEPFQKWQMTQPWASPYIDIMSKLGGAAPPFSYIGQEQGPGLFSQMMPALGLGLGGYFGGGGTLGAMGSSIPGFGGLGGLLGGIGGLAGGAASGIGGLISALI